MGLSSGASNEPILCLRWMDKNNPSSELNLPEAFRDLRQNQDFFDVTLGCSNNNGSSSIQAHKVILSAYSNVFKEMLRDHKNHSDPFIFLKGVTFEELSFLLDFMYEGEVNVNQSQLSSFLTVAKELQVKGLIAKDIEEDEDNTESTNTNSSTKPDSIKMAIEKKLGAKRNSTKSKKNNATLEYPGLEHPQKYLESSFDESAKQTPKRSRVLAAKDNSKIIPAYKQTPALPSKRILRKNNRISDEDIIMRDGQLEQQQFAADPFVDFNSSDVNFLISELNS